MPELEKAIFDGKKFWASRGLSYVQLLKICRCIDVHRHQRISHWHIADMFLVSMLYIARSAACGGAQKSLDHLAANHNRMPMFAVALRDNCPDSFVSAQELVFEVFNGLQRGSRTVYQGHKGGIASVIEDVLKSD